MNVWRWYRAWVEAHLTPKIWKLHIILALFTSCTNDDPRPKKHVHAHRRRISREHKQLPVFKSIPSKSRSLMNKRFTVILLHNNDLSLQNSTRIPPTFWPYHKHPGTQRLSCVPASSKRTHPESEVCPEKEKKNVSKLIHLDPVNLCRQISQWQPRQAGATDTHTHTHSWPQCTYKPRHLYEAWKTNSN